jgi:protein-tyrosine phosphatase
VGSLALGERVLAWDGCFNVRDLGGLATASGGRTRYGVVVRADNVRILSPAGWSAALDYGVRRLVDLRFENERPAETDAPPGVEVIEVSLMGRHDAGAEQRFQERLREATDAAEIFAAGYIRTLERGAPRVATAVGAIADAADGDCVVVHCFAGKDRTGIISALVLSLAGVSDEDVAADYAASASGVEALWAPWLASSADEAELALRRRFALTAPETMRTVLAWVEAAGGVETYLRDSGVSAEQLERLRRRLSGD